MSDIYNKNAREKALLEEAYTNIYNEEGALGNLVKGVGRGIGDVAKGAGRVGAAVGGAGAVVAGGALGAAMNIARTLTADQLKKLGEYALEISADAEDGEFAVDLPDGTNLKFDYDDGKKKRLGSTRPARTASERRLATAEGGYMVGRGDPRVKRPERTQFAISGDEEEPSGDHAKGVKMALEALEMFKDELHVDGHPEDVNVIELADAHDQLSRALHWLLDETDVEYIIGGRATQRSEAQSQKEDHGGHDNESWHEFMRDYEEHGN